MRSVNFSANSSGSSSDSTAADRRARLEGVARLGRAWLERGAATDPQRGDLVRMGALADDLARAADQSPAAITMVRALPYANCRRLNAAEARCLGQVPDRCLLLNGINP